MGYLHKQHPPIIHRDIKPANIIVPTEGDGAVLVDFGIAKEYDREGTTTAIRRCSPGYGAPEQYARGTNPCTDIYGLGATFYALVTGQVPVDALYRMTRLGGNRTDPLLTGPVPDVPPHVSDAIHRAMAINSNDGFANVEEFWQALNAHPIEDEAPPVPIKVPAPVVRSSHVANSVVLGKANTAGILNSRYINLPSTRRHGAFIISFISIALFALLAGVVFGIGLFPGVGNSSHQSTNIIAGPAQKATATSSASRTVTPSAEPGTTPTAAATSTPVPTPTPGGANYPQLVNSYQGSIIDKFTQPPTSSTMALSQIQQNETKISGYLAVGPGLIGNGNFMGTVSTDNKIQFIVAGYQGILPLFFQGQINADRSMSGTYCSYQNDQCNYGSGYGDWNVAPSTSGSI